MTAFTPVFPTVGPYPLASVAGLPNVTVAFPGEHWTNAIASGVILPGEAVIPTSFGGKLAVRRAVAADLGDPRMCIAKQPVSVPDVNVGSIYNPALGPNEIVNLAIKSGQYVHQYRSGAFHLTLCVPAVYAGGDLIAWDDAGQRPTGKPGNGGGTLAPGAEAAGAWGAAARASDALFEVIEFRPYIASNADGQPEGIVTVKSLRAQF